MEAIKDTVKLLVFLIVMVLVITCAEEPIIYEEPEKLELTEFTFIPESPTAKEETNLIFYGCGYYETTSVKIDSPEISIKKHFNGQLKWPCILEYDTISLGKLKKGDYTVTLTIIDTNPFAQDSVFNTETQTLTITNK